MRTTFKPVTSERYNEMLEVLFPAEWTKLGFLVGEPADHRRCKVTGLVAATFDAFARIGDQHYAADEAMTRREFLTLSPELVLANVAGA
jgi:hypothetical protein